MKGYIISVISAALLSGIASLMVPEKWKKYVGLVSGIVILCTVTAPVLRINPDNIFSGFSEMDIEEKIAQGEEMRMDMIEEELTKRINKDIENRLLSEFGAEVKANASVGVNDEGKITGVKAIEVNKKISEKAAKRLCEVYGVEKITTADGGGFF